jgi:hypothetical protein
MVPTTVTVIVPAPGLAWVALGMPVAWRDFNLLGRNGLEELQLIGGCSERFESCLEGVQNVLSL